MRAASAVVALELAALSVLAELAALSVLALESLTVGVVAPRADRFRPFRRPFPLRGGSPAILYH